MSGGLSKVASAIIDSQQNWERKPADFYPTPPDATLALLQAIESVLPIGSKVLEPACGDGAMSRVLTSFGYRVDSSDLRHDSGYGEGGVDFLATEPSGYDAIITNPPFILAEQFIKHAVPRARVVAMLLKSQYWHAARRLKIFEALQPAHILPLTWRPSFLEAERGKSPLMDVIWTVWDAQHDGPTEFRPLVRPIVPAPAANDCSIFDDLLGGADDELESLLG